LVPLFGAFIRSLLRWRAWCLYLGFAVRHQIKAQSGAFTWCLCGLVPYLLVPFSKSGAVCIQRNFDVCAPALSSQPAHTTRHNFGYTNSHTTTEIPTCSSWRCSPLCAHPRDHHSLCLILLTDLCVGAPFSQTTHTHNAITLARLTPIRHQTACLHILVMIVDLYTPAWSPLPCV
jgi:hypothetical protein